MERPDRIASSDAVPVARLAWLAGCLTTAAQPARLAVGFVVALLLWAPGLAWDAAVGPTIDPPGLLAEPWEDLERAEAQATMRRISAQLLPDVTFEGAQIPADQLAAALAARADDLADDPAAAERMRAAARRVRALVPLGSFQALTGAEAEAWAAVIDGARSLDPRPVVAGLGAAFIDVPRACIARDTAFASVFGAWTLLVAAIGFGAFARMEAVHAAGRGMLEAGGALRFAAERWQALAMSWVGPVAVGVTVAIPVVAFGALFRTDIGGWIGAVLYVVPMALGAIAGLAFMLAVLGAPFGPAAVSADGLGGLEGSQRGAIYFLARPFSWLMVMAAAAGIVAIGLAILRTVGWALTLVPAVAVDLGSGGASPTVSLASDPGRWWIPLDGREALVWGWVTVFSMLLSGACLSLVAGALTRAYLLLRESCDGQPTDAVWPYEIPADVTDTLPPAAT
ncbi:MAG: hypothetical protein FGM39_11170 [Phycisphaerales bacterium]|nr:hypothetical protein [Phycisphaerales bacterium]